jgi:hypothetical protein
MKGKIERLSKYNREFSTLKLLSKTVLNISTAGEEPG